MTLGSLSLSLPHFYFNVPILRSKYKESSGVAKKPSRLNAPQEIEMGIRV